MHIFEKLRKETGLKNNFLAPFTSFEDMTDFSTILLCFHLKSENY